MNEELYLRTPGSWTGQPWSFPPTPIIPNQGVRVEMSHQLFFPMKQNHIDLWQSTVQYVTTNFFDGSTPYNVTIYFHVPFSAVQASWETVGFDSYMLLATWGGSFFFVYFLHLVTFTLLKFILPNDSKLLRATPSADVEYTQIK